MTPKEKAKELVDRFDLPSGLMSIERKQCALIAVENEYHSLREMLFNLRSCYVIASEEVYLFRLQQLIDQEKEVKQEIEAL